MIEPKTITEQLLYSTIRIETTTGSIGTGFFFDFNIDGLKYPVIITNKHVIENKKMCEVIFSLHTSIDGNIKEESHRINYLVDWFAHPSQDLCFCFAGPLINEFKRTKALDVFRFTLGPELIWDDSKLHELSAIEDVIMVGYPTGLWDKQNNFPIFRKGITASHPYLDFNGKSIGVVDIACFPGSSGSPIFILNENGYSDKQGTTHIGAKRFIFLGVLSSGPQYPFNGDIIIKEIPTKQKFSASTPTMINLGYYIKSEEILTFEKIIKDIVKNKGNENNPTK